MSLFIRRGTRIRAGDKDLILRSIAVPLGIIFLSVLFCFHAKSLIAFDLEKVTLQTIKEYVLRPYFFLSLAVAALVCTVAFFIYCNHHADKVKQIIHRQSLARMILENGWYETKKVGDSGFFKDVGNRGSKQKIAYFPKMYYEMKHGEIRISVRISMGKYQEQLQNLEKKLESGLYCELISKELKEFYMEYKFLYDMMSSRIKIEEVKAEKGRLRLMKNVYWEYDKLPHMLISGGTGSGKSYYILTLIYALVQTDSKIYILDPKNSDLADLGTVMDNVYYTKEDMMNCLEKFYEDMMTFSGEMKQLPEYETGQNYAYFGLPAHFLIFDEYVAFMEMLNVREKEEVLKYLKQIVMLGRQAGFFLILACQRPDAKYLGDGIRDQFNFRVALGRMSELGYSMMFGEAGKKFFLKQIKGRGYLDNGTSVISEFYTPLVPKDFDFLKEIGAETVKNIEVNQ